jgi:CDP-diacylglycerol--glycerol-3-phosphate 3-phosphatidyltransferase
MILIPVFLIFLYLDMRYWALAVFIIASASDAVDGYIARHYNQVTNFGKFMDPLADKVLVITAMCYYIEAQQMAAWVVAIVIFREFAVSGLRLIAVEQGRVIAAAKSGKIKTTVTMVALILMLVMPVWAPEFSHTFDWICSILILLTTVYSGIEYFVKNKDVFKDAD